MAVVSISLPDQLLHSADRLIEKRGYSGRSEFVRACVRDYLTAQGPAEHGGRCSATLTLVYPEGRERQFSALRHTFGDVVRTMIHGQVGDSCLEVFVLEGKAERIQAFADSLRGTRDALQVAVVYTDLGKDAHAETAARPDEARKPKGR